MLDNEIMKLAKAMGQKARDFQINLAIKHGLSREEAERMVAEANGRIIVGLTCRK